MPSRRARTRSGADGARRRSTENAHYCPDFSTAYRPPLNRRPGLWPLDLAPATRDNQGLPPRSCAARITMTNTTPTPTAPSPMPMFYTSPRPLDKVRDARLRLSKPDHYRFAAKTNAIPLLLEEFPMAAAYYPIVFAAGPSPIPAAVVGLCNDSNLYLDAEGRWRNGAYLPAYVRRYPFILMDDPDAQQFVLCIDEASETLGLEGEHPLFEDGEKMQLAYELAFHPPRLNEIWNRVEKGTQPDLGSLRDALSAGGRPGGAQLFQAFRPGHLAPIRRQFRCGQGFHGNVVGARGGWGGL